MSRPSKPKPAPAEAPKTEPLAPAPVAAAPDPAADAPTTAPETTGAVSAPASAAAVAPAAPVATATQDEDHSQVRGPEGYTVVVTGPAKGRWRIGRKFGPEPVSIPAQELTEPELRALDEDPELTLKMVPIED